MKRKSILKTKQKTHRPVKQQSNHSALFNGVPTNLILRLQRAIGNRAFQHLIQTKLKVNQTNDPYEREANQVAEAVMRMPEPKAQRQPENDEGTQLFQAKPLAEQITPLVQKQAEEEEEEENIQPKHEADAKYGLQRQVEEEDDEKEILQTKKKSERALETTRNLQTRINTCCT